MSFWDNKRVLISGITGFVGAALSEELLGRGAIVCGFGRRKSSESLRLRKIENKVEFFEGDVNSGEDISAAFSGFNPEVVFHLAAQSSVKESGSKKEDTFRTNVNGTKNFLEECVGKNCGLVFASSTKVYGEQKKKIVDESCTLNANSVYGISKARADLTVREYAAEKDVKAVVLRTSNIFGMGDMHSERIVPGSIHKILSGKKPVIYGDGSDKRDFVYIKDAVNAYLLAAEQLGDEKVCGNAFNIAAGKHITLASIVEKIIEISGKETEIEFVERESEEEKESKLSVEKAKNILDWKYKYSLDRALRETFEWYKVNRI